MEGTHLAEERGWKMQVQHVGDKIAAKPLERERDSRTREKEEQSERLWERKGGKARANCEKHLRSPIYSDLSKTIQCSSTVI